MVLGGSTYTTTFFDEDSVGHRMSTPVEVCLGGEGGMGASSKSAMARDPHLGFFPLPSMGKLRE